MKRLILIGLCVLFVAGTALADCDVFADAEREWELDTSQKIGDNGLCTKTEPASDIRFWSLWNEDTSDLVEMAAAKINSNELKSLLWADAFQIGGFTERERSCESCNGESFGQINIPSIEEFSIQDDSEICWPELSTIADRHVGSLEVSFDRQGNAVYVTDTAWQELLDRWIWRL